MTYTQSTWMNRPDQLQGTELPTIILGNCSDMFLFMFACCIYVPVSMHGNKNNLILNKGTEIVLTHVDSEAFIWVSLGRL